MFHYFVVLCFQAEQVQQEACDKFEQMSDKAKEELNDFKERRVEAFKKNLMELAELEIKHAESQVNILKKCLAELKTSD
ncbi:hypothetical protein M8J77_006681 [Diaphorina citri]|nr:hypothetical protein M8J77_006681 [Diaphorina citri]